MYVNRLLLEKENFHWYSAQVVLITKVKLKIKNKGKEKDDDRSQYEI